MYTYMHLQVMVFHIHSHVVMSCCVAWGFIVPSFKGEDRRRFATICDDHAGDMAAYLIFWGKTWIILGIFHGEPAWFIWMNYIDLAVTSLEWWFGFGESSPTNIISVLFRSVNCCTLNQNTVYISRITSLIDWYLVNYWKMSLLRIYPTDIGVHSQIYRTIRTEWSTILVHFHGKLRT